MGGCAPVPRERPAPSSPRPAGPRPRRSTSAARWAGGWSPSPVHYGVTLGRVRGASRQLNVVGFKPTLSLPSVVAFSDRGAFQFLDLGARVVELGSQIEDLRLAFAKQCPELSQLVDQATDLH